MVAVELELLELMAVLVAVEQAEMAHHLRFQVQMSLEQVAEAEEHFSLDLTLQAELVAVELAE